jgi:hypothetical protein
MLHPTKIIKGVLMIKDSKEPVNLCGQFQATRQGLKDKIQQAKDAIQLAKDELQCTDGLTICFDLFNRMGFQQSGTDPKLSTLTTNKATYTLSHGLATDSKVRAFIRLEGPDNFPGVRISCDATQTNYEVGPLKTSPKAIDANPYKHPDTLRKTLVRHLSQFDDLKSLIPGTSHLTPSFIPAARVTTPPGAKVVLPRQPLPKVLKRTDVVKRTDGRTTPKTGTEPNEPG